MLFFTCLLGPLQMAFGSTCAHLGLSARYILKAMVCYFQGSNSMPLEVYRHEQQCNT